MSRKRERGADNENEISNAAAEDDGDLEIPTIILHLWTALC